MIRPKESLLRKAIPKEAIRKALEQWSDRLSGWNQLFTAVLVAGLVIEYLPEIVYFLGGFATVIRPHAEQLREFGGLLVIVGVAGEFSIGVRASRVETDLREENNLVISAAQERVAELQERTAKAEKDAAEANLARVQIEKRLIRSTIRRELDEDEIRALQERLKPLAGQKFAITVASTDDAATMEPELFSWQMRQVLRAADWIEERVDPVMERVGQGIIIECNPVDTGAGFALTTALATVGIAAKTRVIENERLPELRIHVGLI